MPRLGKLRPGPVGLAITLYDVWRRLPPKQRKHGPKAAAKLLELRRTLKPPR